MTLGARDRAGDPRAAEDADEDVLPVARPGSARARTRKRVPSASAFPGALPVPNRQAIEWTIKLGLALGCEIAPRAVFARKNYFYPDLPKGYQISQYDMPSCINGKMIVPLGSDDHVVRIVRAHLEEDAAKTFHVGGETGRIGGAAHSLVDFNRGGTPLVEIVTAPDIRSAEEAKRVLQLLPADDRRARRLGRRDGEGDAAGRRERLGPARRARTSCARAASSRT